MSCLSSGNNENVAVLQASMMLMKGYSQIKYCPYSSIAMVTAHTGHQWLKEGKQRVNSINLVDMLTMLEFL